MTTTVLRSELLFSNLRSAVGAEAVQTRVIDTARMAHDASHFLLEPHAVVLASGAVDVQQAMSVAVSHGVPLTFRSGGTSLSGQAQTRGLLVDTRQNFREVKVLDGGRRVRCQPGATVRAVNAYLAPYRRMIGPDPASETACTIGGVVNNNSSGMMCGTEKNTYRTLDSLELILLSGTLIDTGAADADARLRHQEPELYAGLLRLRDRVRGNADSVRRITHQYSMKNTMGYGLNSFLDFDSALDILAHLIVGSEGTLGFVASATFETVPVRPLNSTALLVFDSIGDATLALPSLIEAGAVTAELMDAASLRVAQELPGARDLLAGLHVQAHTALLVEAQCDTDEELQHDVHALTRALEGAAGLAAAGPDGYFSIDPAFRTKAWAVRKGLYTAVAGARPTGSTALLEDVVVPMPHLPGTVRDLQEMCRGYGYDDAVIFGHAKDANLHFMINPDLRDPQALDDYARFTEDLVDLILDADGSLKAEHGTGRIMAPYVRRQFGAELYQVMREVKELFDPGHLLNPGTIINDDPHAHLTDLKLIDPVDPAVDRCVECGYCEPVCPSRDVTTTPRQRIALMREMNQADPERRAAIEKDFDYLAIQTCAADSLCLLNCPVGIDTGMVMKRLRAEAQNPVGQKAGEQAARHWGATLRTLRAMVDVADRLPSPVLPGVTKAARTVLPTDLVPAVGADLPGPGLSRATRARQQPGDLVLFSSCIGELFEPAGQGPGVARAVLELCDAAGLRVRLPRQAQNLCCGTVWRSKGLTHGAINMAERTARALLEASEDGRVPIVSDASSCTHGLHAIAGDLRAGGLPELATRVEGLTIIDATRYVHQTVLPRLNLTPLWDTALVHPTCADRHNGDVEHVLALAEAVARTVEVPVEAGCCGFAGDRGMLHPELTASATARELASVQATGDLDDFDLYVSSNRTCEMGMSRASGRTFRHVVEALAQALAATKAGVGQG